jgi:hemoglobin-like flavoprotein
MVISPPLIIGLYAYLISITTKIIIRFEKSFPSMFEAHPNLQMVGNLNINFGTQFLHFFEPTLTYKANTKIEGISGIVAMTHCSLGNKTEHKRAVSPLLLFCVLPGYFFLPLIGW